jgi:hypothetical protein
MRIDSFLTNWNKKLFDRDRISAMSREHNGIRGVDQAGCSRVTATGMDMSFLHERAFLSRLTDKPHIPTLLPQKSDSFIIPVRPTTLVLEKEYNILFQELLNNGQDSGISKGRV